MSGFNLHFQHPTFSDAEIGASIAAILDANTELAMATIRGADSYINTAHFAYDDNLNLYIFTPPGSEHSKNLAKNPSVAVAIWNSPSAWSADIDGLQLFGKGEPVPQHELADALGLYSARFPGLTHLLKSPDDTEAHKVVMRFYAIRVERIKLLDEPRFGKRNFVMVDLKTAVMG